jgi:hypothetical protein
MAGSGPIMTGPGTESHISEGAMTESLRAWANRCAHFPSAALTIAPMPARTASGSRSRAGAYTHSDAIDYRCIFWLAFTFEVS